MSHNLAYSEGSGQPYRMAKRRRLKAQIRLQLRQALSCAREPIGHSLRRGGVGVAELAIRRDRECCTQLSSNSIELAAHGEPHRAGPGGCRAFLQAWMLFV